MFRSAILLLVTAISLNTYSQNKNEVVASIDGNKILMDEFVRLYQKNNQNLLNEDEKKTPLEYIDLFINYKLKVHEAEQLGLDTVASFVNELKTYRQELARPYLTDVQFSDQMVKEAYERTKIEVKASHILLRLNENASPADTLARYNEILKLRDQVLQGANFEDLAFQYSEDPSAKNNKGVLGYFTAFQMVFPFENAAYKIPVGEVSMPVRTRFGYHLIHVMDKRPASGQIKVAHIMKRIPANASEETASQLKQQMDSIAELIKKGGDFAKLAKEFSDDRRSAAQGGEMPWFSSAGMLPEFAQPAFDLKNNGDYSPVIKTPYGWHIIKRIAFKPIPTFDEIEQQLIDKIRKNPEISKHSKQQFIKKLKDEYHFKLNEEALSKYFNFISENDQDQINANSEVCLFNYAENEVTFSDFNKYLQKVTTDKHNLKNSLETHFQDFVEQTLVNYEDSQLEQKHPDFKYLMKEYHDGILLFNISEDKIWSAASNDTLGLEAFYQKNKGKYLWEDRFKGWVIKCPNQEIKDFVDEILSADSQISIEELTDQISQHSEDRIQVEKGAFEQGDNPLVDYLVWNDIEPKGYKDGLHFVRGNKIAPEAKTLEEARGLYISDYQNYLEELWIKDLRKKYKVKINKKLIKSVDPV
ncbi:peptidylprolyl isomerase [Sunxiuqinia sp. A32]|uniref:peptidylprolyl isomerase n=1 Tax=Sunxiuqinia sp. A32 TaxID=3461496 RepID=UPI004045F35D